jgi:serine protease Do
VVIAALLGLTVLPAFLGDGDGYPSERGIRGRDGMFRPIRQEAENKTSDPSGIAGGVRYGAQGRPSAQSWQQLHRQEADMVRAVETVQAAVVGVVNLQQADDAMTRPAELVEAGTGSGVIYDVQGDVAHVVTNQHVIAGASRVEVVCGLGERTEAVVVGADPLTDLAVLAIDAAFAKGVATFGDSDQLVPGQLAIAIGNPLGLDFSQTVTAGVISATNRSIPLDFDGDGEAEWELETIQTDAAINPGNSGGALVNLRGEVVGINSMKISETGIEGMGFAIPANDALPVIRQLEEHGAIQRSYLGVTPKNLQAIPIEQQQTHLQLPPDVVSGVVVLDAESPASQAGLSPMDVIVGLDGLSIQSAADLRRYLYTQKRPGDTVRVSFWRGRERKETVVRLTSMPGV